MGLPARKTYPQLDTQQRRNAEIAVIMKFKEMRPDLKLEHKDVVREERLGYVAELLNRKEVKSLGSLSDSQIHYVLDQMNAKLNPAISEKTVTVKIQKFAQHTNISHGISKEQEFAFDILLPYLEWTQEYKEEYLTKRWRVKSEKMLRFAQANAFMFHLLKMAAYKDLKSLGEKKPASKYKQHIPILKAKLGIDQKR